MASKTYYVGSGPYLRRLDNVDGAGPYTWITLPLGAYFSGGVTLLDVKTLPSNSSYVFIVGTYTSVLNAFPGIAYSTDAGVTWTVPGGNWTAAVIAQAATTSNVCSVNELWVVDDNTIYASAEGGLIFKSTDGGLNFNTIAALPGSISIPNIVSLHFPVDNQGVIGVIDAFGANYVLKTPNNGANWYILNSGAPLSGIGFIKSVYYNHTENLIIVLGSNKIYRSTGGGAFIEMFSWPGGNGTHLTWYEDSSTRKFWGAGSKFHIISTTDDFSTITVESAYNPLTATCGTFNMYNYTAGHFYSFTEGFFGVTTCPYGVVHSSSLSTITNTPGDSQNLIKAVNAVWTHVTPPVCYKLTECTTGVVYITHTDLSAYVGSSIKFALNQGPRTPIPGCFDVTVSQTCLQSIDILVLYAYPNCAACLTGCYLLINCDPDQGSDYFTSGDPSWEEFVDSYVQLEGCPGKCYYVTKTINCPSVDLDIPPVVSSAETCLECKGETVTSSYELNLRSVKPGFNTPGCPPEYTVKINCKYAEQVYDEMAAIRYGINICCDHDLDKWDIKKQLLDLKALYDPDLCVSAIVPCDPPCNVTGQLAVYIVLTGPEACPEPTDVEGEFIIPSDTCPDPDAGGVSVGFGYGTPP